MSDISNAAMSDVSGWAKWLADAVARTAGQRFCQPTATYRLQFEPGRMTFRGGRRIVPYLDELGISHLYASPYLKARAGSTHGYAIVDYSQLNPELGRRKRLSGDGRGLARPRDGPDSRHGAQPHERDPAENPWWNDVLENGPASPHAAYFDIDWRPVKEELRNSILLPILGDQYGQVLESGELKLEYREGAFFLRYYQTLLPLDPRTYRTILTPGLDELKETLPPESEDLRELESIVTAIEHLPSARETEPAPVAERQREKEVIKGRLRALTDARPAIAELHRRNVQEFNGTPDDSAQLRPPRPACSMPRSIGSRTGRRPTMRSIIAVSSTSTSWRPSAWRTRRSLRKVTAWFSSCWCAATWMGCGSITSTGCTTRWSICGDCRRAIWWPWAGLEGAATKAAGRLATRRPGHRRRGATWKRNFCRGDGKNLHRTPPRFRSTWSPRRSSPPRKRCPSRGSWPAPRATIF